MKQTSPWYKDIVLPTLFIINVLVLFSWVCFLDGECKGLLKRINNLENDLSNTQMVAGNVFHYLDMQIKEGVSNRYDPYPLGIYSYESKRILKIEKVLHIKQEKKRSDCFS